MQQYSDQYVPYNTGYLATHFQIKPWELVYTAPYAEDVFNGNRINFRTDKHPNATHDWTTVAWQAHGDEIIAKLEEKVCDLN